MFLSFGQTCKKNIKHRQTYQTHIHNTLPNKKQYVISDTANMCEWRRCDAHKSHSHSKNKQKLIETHSSLLEFTITRGVTRFIVLEETREWSFCTVMFVYTLLIATSGRMFPHEFSNRTTFALGVMWYYGTFSLVVFQIVVQVPGNLNLDTVSEQFSKH